MQRTPLPCGDSKDHTQSPSSALERRLAGLADKQKLCVDLAQPVFLAVPREWYIATGRWASAHSSGYSCIHQFRTRGNPAERQRSAQVRRLARCAGGCFC